MYLLCKVGQNNGNNGKKQTGTENCQALVELAGPIVEYSAHNKDLTKQFSELLRV